MTTNLVVSWTRRTTLIVVAIVVAISTVHAGGPLYHHNGLPVKYRLTNPIPFHIDRGPLGTFSESESQTLARESFQVWQDVEMSLVAFADSGLLPVNVDVSNYFQYLDNFTDGINPVVFDEDGSLLEYLYGSGAKTGILGYAISAYFGGGPDEGYYTEGESLMNGFLAGSTFSYLEFKSTMVHEFGHFIGLDHTQINGSLANDPEMTVYIPTMYPLATVNDVPLGELNPDDVVAVCNLYPAPTFQPATGTLSGTVLRFDGGPVRGANVIAIRTDDSLMHQYSTVTDYPVMNTGAYAISGLDSGMYWVRVEPIDPLFTEGSSVGPYSWFALDHAFQYPIAPEFYNSVLESSDPLTDLPGDAVPVSVTVPEGAAGIDIVANVPDGVHESILQDFGALYYAMDLPSEYGDIRYAVRFTPVVEGTLARVEFAVFEKRTSPQQNGKVRVTIHQNVTGSVSTIPGPAYPGFVEVPWSDISENAFVSVDVRSWNLTFLPGQDFHAVLEVIGDEGDTVYIAADDGVLETTRSSSYVGGVWYNFISTNNWAEGFNLGFRAVMEPGTTGIPENDPALPASFILEYNYPNPFNPSTTIPFSVPEGAHVRLAVYDVLGREVALLVNATRPAGRYLESFDASNLATGTYYAFLYANGRRLITPMTLIK